MSALVEDAVMSLGGQAQTKYAHLPVTVSVGEKSGPVC